VLILGETGVGKDVMAQRLHAWSPRARRPFVRVNCAALPEALLESELFGYEKGAFTGAQRRKTGYIESADSGTLFLDEIGELTNAAQVKLLQFLETRTLTRLGGTSPISFDVRVVCATHRDLLAMAREGRFREDLYYRISAFALRVPPLRQRPTEVPLLAKRFLERLAAQAHLPVPTFTPEALELLTRYAWPGNVRELRNVIEHALLMTEGRAILASDLPVELRTPSANQLSGDGMKARLLAMERRSIEEALSAEGGNRTRAAERLGMPRRTLLQKLARYRQDT
jgi:transcriptional regulator with PAS, ATPase and Fis domain